MRIVATVTFETRCVSCSEHVLIRDRSCTTRAGMRSLQLFAITALRHVPAVSASVFVLTEASLSFRNIASDCTTLEGCKKEKACDNIKGYILA